MRKVIAFDRLVKQGLAVGLTAFIHAGPAISASEQKAQTFIEFSKITVGPFDNFESYVSKDEKYLYYTQSQYMSSHIRRLDFKTGLTTALLDLDADSKSPRISPDGKHVAFTYYREDAKGDVCYTPIKKVKISCISKANVVEHSPFWLNDHSIAYISTNDRGDRSELIVYNLQQKSHEKLLEGVIFSPNISPDGSQLVYRGEDDKIIIFDLKQRTISRQFRIAIPGLTGLAHFGKDGRYLYFTQYMLDSNRDLRIDARDQGAIFRIDLQKNGSQLIPEQLSSTDQNCSYPFPSQSSLFVTCAFEGSLDVYKIPFSGTVAESWNADDLWDAHLRVRSYADRLLLVNRLLTSFAAISELEYFERSLHNLLYMEEWLAAASYAKILQEMVPASQKASYQALVMIASSMARWETLPNQRVTAEFSRFIDQQRRVIKTQLQSSPDMLKLVEAYFSYMLAQYDAAKNSLRSIPSGMIALYLHSKLNMRLLADPEERVNYFFKLARDKKLPEQSRIYYLSVVLEAAAGVRQPQQLLQKLLAQSKDERLFELLIENEIDLYTMAKIVDEKELVEFSQGITKRALELRPHYFASRLFFNRNMIMFSRYDKINQLTAMASLWLSHTQKHSMEYPYVIEAYRQNTLDTAYGYLYNSEKSRYAEGAFFGNLRMSDNLEAHYHYTRLILKDNGWPRLENSFQLMLKNGLVSEQSYEFVKLVRSLLQSGGKLKEKEIDKGIKTCESLPDQQSGVGVKYLVLGYLYQLKLDHSREGFRFDRKYADLAHRNYLLALDLSWNNDRIRASAFQNLALLHLSIRNYSLAAEYFSRRGEIPFIDREDELAYRWYAANSFYKANRFAEATEQSEKGLKLQGDSRAAWLEKTAFYAMNAGQFAKAINYYQQYFQAQSSSQPAAAGIMLSYAYSLHMAGKESEAKAMYLKALAQSSQEKGSAGSKGRVSYQPLKTRFVAHGLLSQLKIANAEKIQHLQQRLALYPSLRKAASDYQLSESDLIAQELKDRQRLALLYHENKQVAEAGQQMLKALEQAANDGKAIAYISQPIQQSLKNALFHFIWDNPAQLSAEVLKHAQAIVKGMEAEAKDNLRPSPQFLQMLIESQLFLKALEAQVQNAAQRKEQFVAQSEALMQEEHFLRLKEMAPAMQESLVAYQKAMENHL